MNPAHPQTAQSSVKQRLLELIHTQTARIGIVGLGYVGLPLALTMVEAGFQTTGFDVNEDRVRKINAGRSYVDDIADDQLQAGIETGRLQSTTDFSVISDMDVVIIAVPTPITRNRVPDISYIEKAAGEIAKYLRSGQLIVLESTTYPGTTEEVLLPIFKESGLSEGEEFFLAYSPERVDPGNAVYHTRNTPKIVGGLTPACNELAVALYEKAITTVVPVSSVRVAEMVKVFENTFRAVNIGLVNELALVCDKLQLNVWEVIDAAATKPFGMMKFTPGPGIGGHCIPVDPFYLTWKVKELGFQTRFIELAGEINTTMPHFVREKVLRALGESFKSINGSTILAIGVAYKPDVSDWRESPAQYVIDILAQDGALVHYHDPYVDTIEDRGGRAYFNCQLTDGLIAEADCVLVLTNHHNIDFNRIARHAKVIVDTRNIAEKIAPEYRHKIRLL
jgi:UDP-N-acetyl-D-glucosamine dehydrogenase